MGLMGIILLDLLAIVRVLEITNKHLFYIISWVLLGWDLIPIALSLGRQNFPPLSRKWPSRLPRPQKCDLIRVLWPCSRVDIGY
jgi:hypothetical protein